ncbi:N-6 DNA methylase [Algibacter miyuki]|uniref:site-specific DNA-methyltransferase (adenine-specific) n=1 Tax=Algibacter miyuki TaxID=1306933 RepID=A0ABV5H4B8_9FLAO|nr:N-6 DNA methylase [Algibacter miyuki]MDN3665623.1 N-6 DNA methylase [Algibacter miyuki]
MLKNKDVPSELKNFNSLFFSFQYKYDLYNLYDDLLTLIICCLARQTEERLYFETIKKYEKKELTTFAHLMGELFIIYNNSKTFGEWCDPLGEYYECLASNSKKSAFGQFFTPKAVCDMMANFVTPKDWGKQINEPCSGSGRMILASNQITKGNYFIAQDLDPICCKMTAINMAMHEIRGEVHNMDTLRMANLRMSYSINFDFYKHKTPLILLKRPD